MIKLFTCRLVFVLALIAAMSQPVAAACDIAIQDVKFWCSGAGIRGMQLECAHTANLILRMTLSPGCYIDAGNVYVDVFDPRFGFDGYETNHLYPPKLVRFDETRTEKTITVRVRGITQTEQPGATSDYVQVPVRVTTVSAPGTRLQIKELLVPWRNR